MSGRALGVELMSLAALTIAVYAVAAVVVSAFNDGDGVSLGAVAAVVVISYALARMSPWLGLAERAVRLWSVALSVLLFSLIVRLEISADPYLWRLGWLGDLLSNPGDALEDREARVAALIVLGAAWLLAAYRAARPLSFERVLTESNVGLVALVLAVALAPAAEAPALVRWLPAPYMFAALSALALAHLLQVEVDERRPVLVGWTLWTVGPLVAIAGAVAAVSAFAPPSPAALLDAVAFAGSALVLAALFVVSPFIIALAFAVELVAGLIAGTGAEPDLPEPPPPALPEPDPGSPLWSRIAAGVLLASVALGALAALWFSFRSRFARAGQDEGELREAVSPAPAGARRGADALPAGALRRLRRRPTPRDAVGRLYVAMLRRAAEEGLARPPAATPGEFAPLLQAHFASSTPHAISDAYIRARYAGRSPPREEIDSLRRAWRELARER